MKKEIVSQFSLGSIEVFYVSDGMNLGLVMLPKGYQPVLEENPQRVIEPLVQLKLTGDAYPGPFGNGITMHNSETARMLKFQFQEERKEADGKTIVTYMQSNSLKAKHELIWYEGYDVLETRVTVTNISQEILGLEMLDSFSVGMISPLDKAYKPNKIKIHRLRGRWAQEVKLDSCWAEDLMLTPTAMGANDVYSERFGQRGNKTTGVFSPFLAVEDTEYGILWGAQLVIDGSWQMEIFNRDETLSISGGLADYDFGHWMKNLVPGQSFESPSAYVTVCKGNLDTLCDTLVSIQQRAVDSFPESEKELPVMFNEWCSSWGDPSYENVKKQVEALKGRGIKYFVIDAGWFKEKENKWFEMIGDWEPSREKYPGGIKKVADMIREAGMIPGIWCEIETCGRYSNAFQMKDHLLTKFGKQIIANDRKYWDFRDPWTVDYLTKKIVDLLDQAGFGYLKIDSNESVGIGCDGAESLGEGLRQNLECFENFMRNMQKRLPDLIIENCSSGGMRVTPKLCGMFPIFSFSDSFECSTAPLISADMHRVALPRQSQIWCTPRSTDDEIKLIYKFSTGFLGRMCLSGDIVSLNDEQNTIIDKAVSYYSRAVNVIKDGISRHFGPKVNSYIIPNGWQAVVREGKNTNETMIVLHTFDVDVPEKVDIPLSDAEYEVSWSFKPDMIDFVTENGVLKVNGLTNNVGCVIMLKKTA